MLENNYNNDIYGEYEKDIENYINKYSRDDYSKILNLDNRTNISYVFSEIRRNIIKWYPFKSGEKILEIGANYGEITGEFLDRGMQVTALEFSKSKCELIAKRYSSYSKPNLKILCNKIEEIDKIEKFDYITLLGVGEYAKQLGYKNVFEMIKIAKQYLNENGSILIAMDNKFAVKYMAGSTRNNQEVPFANYKEYINKNYKLYGKNELIDKIKEIGFEKIKFYYPLPDYKLTNVIYTDKFIEEKRGKISYNIYYREDEEIMFNEISFMNQAMKNKQFDCFTNSFLIELNPKSEMEFVKFTNMRKNECKIYTEKINDKFYKIKYLENAKQHMEKIRENIKLLNELGFSVIDECDGDCVESKNVDLDTLDIYLLKEFEKNKDIEYLKNNIQTFFDYLKNKLGIIESDKKLNEINEIYDTKELNYTKNGFIDLLFSNVFYDGKEYFVYDQEWFEENVPLEFIYYRNIKQLYFENIDLQNFISREEMLQYFKLDKFVEIFEELERKIQEKITDKNIVDFYREKSSRIISIEDIKFRHNQELGKVYKEKDELTRQLQEMLQENIKIQKNKKTNFLKRILNRRR